MGATLAFDNFLQNSNELSEKNNFHNQIFPTYFKYTFYTIEQTHTQQTQVSVNLDFFRGQQQMYSTTSIYSVLHGVTE